MARRQHPEDDLQKACVKLFKYQYPNLILFHIPNGGWRTKAEAGVFKAMGVIPGVADLFLMKAVPKNDGTWYHGLFIEMKAKGRTQSDKQKEFQSVCEKNSYAYSVADSIDKFLEVVENYLKGYHENRNPS